MNRQQRRAAEKQFRKGQSMALDEGLISAISLHQQGRLSEAETIYRAILQALPEQPDACHYLGLLLHQRGQSVESIELIQRAIELSPTYTDAYNNLGNVYKETGALEKAAECYRKVIERVPEHAPALNNLGIVLQNQGAFEEAIVTLLKATALAPNNYDFFHNLGNAYRKQGSYKQAAEAFRRSIALQPYQADAYKNLWRTHYVAQEFEEAAEVLRQWLEFDPANPVACHTLAAYTGEGDIPDRASDAYVQEIFDKFAGSFDQVLERLEYRAPELVAGAVDTLYQKAAQLCVLDAGCGTGLCGPLLKPYAATLIGVDLSSNMLAKAVGRQVYEELVEAELVSYLEQRTGPFFDLIVSADTLVYFGELRPFLRAAKNALRAGGHLVFTLEKGASDLDYKLNIHGRYSHARDYVETAMVGAGLRVCGVDEVTLRKEGGEPVLGLLVTAELCC